MLTLFRTSRESKAILALRTPGIIAPPIVRFLILGCLFVGCDLNQTASRDEAEIVPSRGVLSILFNTPMDHVLAILGQPEPNGVLINDHDTWLFILPDSSGPLQGLTFYFSEKNDQRLDMIEVKTPFDGKTRQGIGIGSPVTEVLDALGRPSEGTLTPDGSVTYCVPDNRLLGIKFTSGGVTKLFLSPNDRGKFC